jgi:hypothetical protein
VRKSAAAMTTSRYGPARVLELRACLPTLVCAKQRMLAAEKNEHKLNLRSNATFSLSQIVTDFSKWKGISNDQLNFMQPGVNPAL